MALDLLPRREYLRVFVLPLLEFGRTMLCCPIRPSSPMRLVRFWVVFCQIMRCQGILYINYFWGPRLYSFIKRSCGFSRPSFNLSAPDFTYIIIIIKKIWGPREATTPQSFYTKYHIFKVQMRKFCLISYF